MSSMSDVRAPVKLRRSRNPALGALDRSGGVLQQRMRDVLVGSALILVPAVALNLWMTVIAFDRFDSDEAFLPSMSSNTTGAGVEDVSVWMAIWFASFVTTLVGHFAAQILIGDRFGTFVSLRRAIVVTMKRLPSLAWLWLLTHWWVPLFSLVIVSSQEQDIGGLVFMYLVFALFASTFTLLAVPAMVGERIGPFKSATRAFRLARLRFGACMLFLVLATVLASSFLFGLATLAPLLEVTGFVTFGGATWLVQGILVQLGVLLVVPLIALATAQMYIEVRLDAEGLDLVIDADAAFGARV
jgi:hypothetical protein